ncbi:succinylglutamate desuccinylase/aspartoacylase family protein [Halosimplex sp. TS25]|uniref:succinylglutamate desuccinylase/aspartoacylase domain-containing protein n=1 Tax=Halosimplex rarum TaxID=3396619 RepID=UPI0039EA6A92
MRIETLGDGEPEIAVVGGIHGDEPAGVEAVEHFMETRPDVARPVKLVIANEEAVDRGVRYVEADLNRSFPGRADGQSHEIRLAHALGEEVGDCLTLALHTTHSYEGMFALVDEVRDLARDICPRLSVDAVVETGHAEGRIFEVAPDTIEVECGYQGSDQAARNARQVTREFLAATGALPAEQTPHQTDLPVFRLGDPVPKVAAETYEVFVDNFEEVFAGERIAAADGEAVIADTDFHPVLLSAYGYEDVFGYTAERVGTLSG